jgi:ATP-binding cassette subfamily B protein
MNFMPQQQESLREVCGVIRQIWRLLEPLHGRYKALVWFMFLSETLQIAMSFTGSGMILLLEHGATFRAWALLIVAYLVLDEAYLQLNNGVLIRLNSQIDFAAYQSMRERVLAQLLRLDPAWHDKHNSGQEIGKVNEGISKLREIASKAVWDVVPTTIQTFLSLLPLLYFSPGAALLTLIGFAVYAWLSIAMYIARKPKIKVRYDLYERAYQQFDENVKSHRTIVAFGQEELFLKEHSDVLNQNDKLNREEVEVIIAYDNLRERLVSYLKHGIYILWIWQLTNQRMDIAMFVFTKILLDRLFHSCHRFSTTFRELSEASESVCRLNKLMQEVPDLVDGTYAAPPTSAEIELRNIWFDYGADSDDAKGVIQGLSLKLARGSVTAFVGKSGVGKSTLVKLLRRELDLLLGIILLNGVDAKKWLRAAYRRFFGEVPQSDRVDLFDASVFKNVAIGKPDATLEEIQRAAKLAGLHERIEQFPEKYQTIIGDRGHKLSGGEKQRLALARAFLARRPILILDEATSSVDSETEQDILDGIKIAAQTEEMTVIVIAHRLSTIQHADNIVVLDEGRIVEQGTHDQLVRKDGHYAKLVELQSTAWQTSPVLV